MLLFRVSLAYASMIGLSVSLYSRLLHCLYVTGRYSRPTKKANWLILDFKKLSVAHQLQNTCSNFIKLDLTTTVQHKHSPELTMDKRSTTYANFRIPHFTHRSIPSFHSFHYAFYLLHSAVPHFTNSPVKPTIITAPVSVKHDGPTGQTTGQRGSWRCCRPIRTYGLLYRMLIILLTF